MPSNALYEALLFFLYVLQNQLLLCRNMVVYAGVEEQPKLGRSKEDLTEVSIPFSLCVNTYPVHMNLTLGF